MKTIRHICIVFISGICLSLFFSANSFAKDGRKEIDRCNSATSIAEAKEIISKGKIRNAGFQAYAHYLLIVYQEEVFSCSVGTEKGTPRCTLYDGEGKSAFFCEQ